MLQCLMISKYVYVAILLVADKIFTILSFHNSGFSDVFDADYFITQMNGFVNVVKELPPEISSKEPHRVDCSKRKGQFDYIESVLPSLLKYQYISITPAMSQRRDRYYFFLSQNFSTLRLRRTMA